MLFRSSFYNVNLHPPALVYPPCLGSLLKTARKMQGADKFSDKSLTNLF